MATRFFSTNEANLDPGRGQRGASIAKGCSSVNDCVLLMFIIHQHSFLFPSFEESFHFNPFQSIPWGLQESSILPRFYMGFQRFLWLHISAGGEYDGSQLGKDSPIWFHQEIEHGRRYDGSPWESNRWSQNLTIQTRILLLYRPNTGLVCKNNVYSFKQVRTRPGPNQTL